jgi:hypothetical protein
VNLAFQGMLLNSHSALLFVNFLFTIVPVPPQPRRETVAFSSEVVIRISSSFLRRCGVPKRE